jgi:hypothetical protein
MVEMVATVATALVVRNSRRDEGFVDMFGLLTP